jgi:hypothetical protein
MRQSNHFVFDRWAIRSLKRGGWCSKESCHQTVRWIWVSNLWIGLNYQKFAYEKDAMLHVVQLSEHFTSSNQLPLFRHGRFSGIAQGTALHSYFQFLVRKLGELNT